MKTILDRPLATGAELAPATRARYRVVGFALALAMVTYLDRVCISTVAKQIMADLSLSQQQMSLVFSAFAFAYAIFEIPTAAWADRRGTRTVLTRIVGWWSAFTIATAGALNFSMLLVTRFLFGAGEAGAWPSVASTFARWIPAKERGTIQGIFFAGAHLAGGFTPVLVMFMLHYMNWRTIFVVFGLLGIVWAAAWHWWFRDDPAQHPAVNAAELAQIQAGRQPAASHHVGWEYWRRLFTHRNTLPLCLMYVGNSFPIYFCMTWLPTYLEERQGMQNAMLALAVGMPMYLSIFGDLFGGLATDRLTRRFGSRVGRTALGAGCYLLAAVCMIVAATTRQPVVAIAGLSVAVTAAMFTLSAAWSTCLDIGGRQAGVVSATMNTAGQVGSIINPILTIYVKDHFGGWNAPLFMMAGLFLLGAICWGLINPQKQIFE